MNVTRLTAAIVSVATLVAAEAFAASPIAEKINRSATITVSHPDALDARLMPVAEPAAEAEASEAVTDAGYDIAEPQRPPQRRIGGYRVQVFSDSDARTAKAEAKRKARAVADAFPKYPTYVVYTSPYWRLKVGDFKSADEAEVAATEIKRAFPAYAKEIRVVRDRINTSR